MNNCNKEQPKILPDLKKVFVSREEFLKLLGLTLSGVIGLLTVIPGAAFVLNYLFLPKRNDWINIGPVEKFKEGTTVDVVFKDPNCLPWDGIGSRRSAWLRRVSGENFIAFAINCTHLGCPVRWEARAELFMCPCHGGVYYSDGEVAAGPPPRPLHQYPLRINKGQVEMKVIPVLEG
jgi:menaquinol-cytochrome c reductase iron-sulfur subunit